MTASVSAPASSASFSTSEDSSSSDASPPVGHAAPVARTARQPRRPHAENSTATTSTSTARVSRPPRPPPRARSPPAARPRSAPPSKRKPKKTNSPSLDIFLADKSQSATAPDVTYLRQNPPLITREAATDVLIGGKVHRLPEQSIKLDFWTKALGLSATRRDELAGSSVKRPMSLPSFSPRQNLLTPPSNDCSPNNSPSVSLENTFGTSGGDFGHLGRSSGGSSKRSRSRIRIEDMAYDGPLFGASERGKSPGLAGGMGGMQIGRKPAPPTINTSPTESDGSGFSAKRQRSESPTTPTLSSASIQVLSPSGLTIHSAPSTPSSSATANAATANAAHVVAAGNLPRASSPLRTSFTLHQGGLPAPHALPRSHLGTETVFDTTPPAPRSPSAQPVDILPNGSDAMEGVVSSVPTPVGN